MESSRFLAGAVRNEGEAHQMSPDNEQPVEPSPSGEGEGCQRWWRLSGKTGNGPTANTPANTTAGSAGAERDTRGMRLKDESCDRGRESPTASASGPTARLEPAVAAVGAVHSSDEGSNDAGAKGPYLVDGDSEVADEVNAAERWLPNTGKTSVLPRTLATHPKRCPSTVCVANDLGKPDAGNPPVRFDEGRGERKDTDNYGLFNPLGELSAYSTRYQMRRP